MNIESITNRELFLKTLEPYISKEGIDNIEDAYQFAKYGHGHRNQEREGGVRYFEHPRAVAEIIINELGIKNDWKVVALALLHDVVEDTWLLNYRVVKKCFGEDFAHWLRWLTREENHSDEEWDAYIKGIKSCGEWRVILVKLCDRLHNLRTCQCLALCRRRKYVAETEMYFFGLSEKLRLCIPAEFTEVPEKLERALRREVEELQTLLKEEKAS